MGFFRRTSRRAAASVHVAPEFGVRLTLRKGDRIVHRDARGAIHVTPVTEDHMELADVCRGARQPTTGG